MPVPHGGTATAVASTGTYDAARLGIEGRSVREDVRSCQPRRAWRNRKGLDLGGETHYPADFMPSPFANAVHVGTSIITFAIFAALPRS